MKNSNINISRKKIIYLVILNWNRPDLTKQCLNSAKLIVAKKNNIKILLVDNGSDAVSLDLINRSDKSIHIIRNRKNLGWSGGNNVAIKYALKNKADCIVLINNDTVLTKNTISGIIAKLYSDPRIGIVSPKIYRMNRREKIISNAGNFFDRRYFSIPLGSGEKDVNRYDNIDQVEYVAGTIMAIKKEVFEEIGLFDERYFLYYEDADFCKRAIKHNFSCNFEQSVYAYHVGEATTINNSPLHVYYNARNHLLFVERYAPFWIKIREYLRIPKSLFEYYKNSKSCNGFYGILGIKDYILRRFGARIYW